MIVGAGTGGLCLAQGLRKAGVDVRLFERDETPLDRLQGYRLHISATGNRALRRCLPEAVFDHFAEAAAKPNTGVSFLDEKLHRLLAIAIPPRDPADPDSEIPVSRIALRKILLEGLDEVVTFGRAFKAFELRPGGEVVAHFRDGDSVVGDVLVGADGASSPVRGQLLPQARRLDTGLVAISGKFPLDEQARRETPEAVFKGPTLILGPHGCFLFASAVEYDHARPSAYDREEYVMWGFSARRETLGLSDGAETLSAATAKALVLDRMEGWHPKLRRLIERAEPASMTSFEVKSAEPVAPWPSGSVTLLGDALHNMTPFRGMGANVALRDAAALCDALVAVDQTAQPLIPALAAYEAAMIDYGFAAVRVSLSEMKRLHAKSPLSRGLTKATFRVVDMIAPAQKLFRGQR